MAKRKLSLREYAREKGITLQCVYQRVWADRLPAEKVDGRWLIEVDDQPKKQEQATR